MNKRFRSVATSEYCVVNGEVAAPFGGCLCASRTLSGVTRPGALPILVALLASSVILSTAARVGVSAVTETASKS